jgi:hypothetical protein
VEDKTLEAIFTMRTFLLAIIISATSFGLKASPQIPDILIYNGKKLQLFTNPLEGYLKSRGFTDNNRGCNSSSCWRGYIATWTIRNDSLFLTHIESCGIYASAGVVTGPECNQADTSKVLKHLNYEFGGVDTFFHWFSGQLRSPQGRLIEYVHMGYGSTYEKDVVINVESGITKGIQTINNPLSDPRKIEMFNYDLVQDTLFYYIAKGLDWKKVGGEMICDGWYQVKLSNNGRVRKIKYDQEQGESNWEAFWWNLRISDCRRTLRRPVRNIDFKKMLTHGGQVPTSVKLEMYYSVDSNELRLEK